MAKEPRPGRVKTRLGRDMGMVRAAWWYRHQTNRLIRRLHAPSRWRTVLAVSPDVAAMTSRVWPYGPARIGQGTGDIGQRMRHVFLALSGGATVLVGSDIPDISQRHITRAFQALGTCDAVFGPARDGGFWLVGMRGRVVFGRNLFCDTRWSSPYALQDTLRGLKGFRVSLIDRLTDVDRLTDL